MKEINSEMCIKCNLCCRFITIHTQYLWLKDHVQFFQARGFTCIQEHGFLKLEFGLTCQQLGVDGKCKIYDNRPEDCRKFDCNYQKLASIAPKPPTAD